MQVIVQRDQAVWERETFAIEVPDGLEGEALRDAIEDVLEADEFLAIDLPSYEKEILDSVSGLSTEMQYMDEFFVELDFDDL